MYNLNKREKLKFVLEFFQKNEISAYEIAQNTSLTETGVQKIVQGKSKNPHENSLNEILQYFENRTLRSGINAQNSNLGEPVTEPYNLDKTKSSYSLNDCIKEQTALLLENQKYIREIVRLQSILDKNKIFYENIFEDDK